MANLVIPQGSTWGMGWPIVDVNGQPVDLTGWTVKAQVRTTAESATVLYEWATPTTATVTGQMVSLLLTPAVSSAWTWRQGVYDVELTDPTGKVYRIAEGQVFVTPEVTR